MKYQRFKDNPKDLPSQVIFSIFNLFIIDDYRQSRNHSVATELPLISNHCHLNTIFAFSGFIRLVGGNWNGEGRVEILHNDHWGTVCDDSWDMNDARVVCRALGYADASSAPHSAHFGQGSGKIWLDDVNCLGNESSIESCSHNGWSVHNCGHSEDASVICLSKYDFALSLLILFFFFFVFFCI